MDTEPVSIIERALTEADGLLCRLLASQGLENTDHIMLAITPDDGAVIRSNCEPATLRTMAFLVEIADQEEAGGESKAH